MNLLIVEPEATGHRMALYVRLLVRAATLRGWTVSLLTTPQAMAHPCFQLVLDEAEGQMPVYFMKSRRGTSSSNALALLNQQYECYQNIKEGFCSLLKKAVPDLVYISCLDDFDKVLALLGTPFGEVPFAGLLTSVKFHRNKVGIGPPCRSDTLYEWLFHRVLSIMKMKSLLIIDEAFKSFAIESGSPRYDKLTLIPDVGEVVGFESKEDALTGVGLHPGAFVVLVYGSLSRRKGVEELFNAADSRGAPLNLSVVLAGTPDEYMQALLNMPLACRLRARGVLSERLFFHNDQDEFRAFRAADAVWLGYVGGSYGSSGVLYQAGSLGLPVIATSQGLIGWLTARHELGLTIDPKDVVSTRRAIQTLQDDPTLRARFGARGIQYAAAHSAEKYGDAVCTQLAVSYNHA